MFSYPTPYGELKAISASSAYPDSRLKDCVVNERTELCTPLGILNPQYEHGGVRRKAIYSVSFFPSGKISRIALNGQTEVETPIGRLPAELITFYESGRIKRLFPLNGRISGYWSEEDEYGLAEEFDFSFEFGNIQAKIIGICFYESGAVRSITFWPGETVAVKTPAGEQRVRTGLSLYPSGRVSSIEPAGPAAIATPIGEINAYDANAIGINGDSNSLKFGEKGEIKSLVTFDTKISVAERGKIIKTYSPVFIKEMYEEEIYFQPLNIDFGDGTVRFNGQDEYEIAECSFTVMPYNRPERSRCTDCSSCSRCSPGGDAPSRSSTVRLS